MVFVCFSLFMVVNAKVNPVIASTILLRSYLCVSTLSAIILMDLSCCAVGLEIT